MDGKRRKLSLGALGGAALIAGVAGVNRWLIRPWHLRWGAADEEVQRAAPKELKSGEERGRWMRRLHGKRLRGPYALVRMARRPGDWLLIKRREE